MTTTRSASPSHTHASDLSAWSADTLASELDRAHSFRNPAGVRYFQRLQAEADCRAQVQAPTVAAEPVAAASAPETDTMEQTARKLVHAARNADDPHAEAGRIVTGLWSTPDTYSRGLLAAIEALRPTAPVWRVRYLDSDGLWSTGTERLSRVDAEALAARVHEITGKPAEVELV